MAQDEKYMADVSVAGRVAEIGLPPLEGSVEDVDAARAIRHSMLVAMDQVLTDLRSNATLTLEQQDTAVHPDTQVSALQVKTAQRALNIVRKQTSAQWWIARANTDPAAVLREAAEQAGA